MELGFEKRFASIKDITKPPTRNAAIPSGADGSLISPDARLSIKTEKARFKKPHPTFNIADDSFPNGVMCLFPIAPEIKWGRELKKNIPLRKNQTKSAEKLKIISPPIYFHNKK